MPDRKVLARRCRSRSRSASARHRGEYGNQPNAQDAASCPAASATAWLFAEEPRLGNAASQRWWCQIWSSAAGFSSNSAGAPAQPSSSKRTHTHDSSRMPSSMPLTQWAPRSGGLASHHDRRCAATRSAYRSFPVSAYAAAGTVRYWCRDGSQICLMSPTVSSSRYGTSKAWSSGARRPVFGSACQSGSAMSSRTTPKNSARPAISRSASATRRFTASGSTASSAPRAARP